MKHLFLIATIFCTGLTSFAQNAWVQKDSVNGAPRSVSSSFVVDGDGFILGGLDTDGFRRKVYSYTFWQDDWDDEQSIGGASGDGLDRGSACAFNISNKGYICLGQGETNPFFGDLWQYDPDTDSWSQKANFGGTPRRQAVSFVIDGYAYVGTGIDGGGFCKDMYRYNPANNVWTQMNDFGGSARKEAVGFAMGNQGYIGTGDDGVMTNDFWQYEPSTDTWTEKAPFPGTARKGAVGWGQFPSGFVCLGEDINFSYRNDLWEYNYFANVWQQRADFPGAGRSNATVFIVNDLAFVGTGYDGQFYDDMYAYRRILGIDENALNANVKVFPNPATEKVQVQIEGQDLDLELYSTAGRKLSADKHVQSTTEGFIIYRNGLPTGTYYARLTQSSTGKSQTETIIFVE